MKFYIDISIFSEENGAYGNITGDLELSLPPQIGDVVSFSFAANNKSIILPASFDGFLTVTDRVISANMDDKRILISLSDIMVPTREHALKVADYFELAFDLFLDVY
ncbi:MAG: hypothetical protein ACKE8G_06385 [Methylophagaceae bacterium]